jgi:signal transduction histidine kinase
MLAQEIRKQTPAKIELEATHVPGDASIHLLAYQVVREALRNAVRHAEAHLIHVRVWQCAGRICVQIVDDGRGFEPSAVDRTQHFGLQLLAERVAASGGDLTVHAKPGNGTIVRAVLPVQWEDGRHRSEHEEGAS